MNRKKRTSIFYNKINLEYFMRIKEFVDKSEFEDSYKLFSNYENLTMDIINKNPDIKWDTKLISQNKYILPEAVDYFSNMLKEKNYYHFEDFWYDNVPFIKNMPLQILIKNIDNIENANIYSHKDFSKDTIDNDIMFWKHKFNVWKYAEYITKKEDLENLPDNLWCFVSKNYSLTLEWLKEYHNKSWDWGEISKNKNLSLEWLDNFPDKPWDWDSISKNKNVTIEWLKTFPDKPWDWDELSKLYDLDIEWLRRFPDKSWNTNSIYNNDKLEIEWVIITPKLSWSFNSLSKHENFDISWVDKFPDKEWDWNKISDSKNLTLRWIKKYPDKEWYWNNISNSKYFDIGWIDMYPDKSWNWHLISFTKNFDISWIELYPDASWNWELITHSKLFKIEWIDMYPDEDWDWESISQHKNLQFDWIFKYKEKPWCWGCIYDNQYLYENFTLQMVDRIFDNINFMILSHFQNVSLEWLEKYSSKEWSYKDIYLNNNEYYEEKCREYMAAYKIQQWWYKITLSPEYKIGRKMINKKYDEHF